MDGAVLVMFEEEAFMFFPPTATEQVEIRCRRATMTDRETRLREIRERYEASTPGEWAARCRDSSGKPDSDHWSGLGWDIDGPPEPMLRGQFSSGHDANFIAHAHQDIPFLLAEIERLEAALARERRDNALDEMASDAAADGLYTFKPRIRVKEGTPLSDLMKLARDE